MKKKQKINKAVNSGEWILLGLTALFLCVLFAIRERPAPERGITVRTASSRLPADRSGAAGNASGNAGSASDVTENASDAPDSAPADADSASAVTDSAPADAGSASGTPESVPDAVTPSDTPAVTPSDAAAPSDSAADERVNINTADLAQLRDLPGIGDALAQRIIAYREEHGPFARPEDVMRVSGIGQGKFDAMKGLITV